MQTQPDTLENLFEKTSEYLSTRVDLIKLKAVDKTSDALSSLAAEIAVTVVICVFVFMLGIGVALWLGDLLGKSFYGFFIVAGFYIIAGLVLYIYRNKWIKAPVSRLIIHKALK